ncbi:MAG: (Fe-S)-binding protein [bacterium]
MSEQLIQNFTMKLSTPDCSPQADWYRAIVHLHEDIAEVLPYLHAVLKGSEYDHGAKILLWPCCDNSKRYAFRPQEVVVAPVENREEAQMLVDAIVNTINDVWARRNEIEPDFEGKKPPPKVLDIYKLLPGTNCRECGMTCMSFAAAVRSGSIKVSVCPYLPEQDYQKLVS